VSLLAAECAIQDSEFRFLFATISDKGLDMGRRESREHQRELERLRKRLAEENPKVPLALRLVKNAWAAVSAVVVVLGLIAFGPHISIEPQLALNPINPYTTQFNIKNENLIFDVHEMNAVCWPRSMASANGFSVVSPVPLVNVHHQIPLLGSGLTSTVDCPPVIGGIGSYSGAVMDAELEIVVSYKQSWWPFAKEERYPFAAKRDVQGAVHWVHITPNEEKSLAELFAKRN
jgi:hypothetical protein